MSTRTTAPELTLDANDVEAIKGLIEEATSGRQNDGRLVQLRIGEVAIDAYASRDWGVGFSRTLEGNTFKEHVASGDLSINTIGAAIGRLVNL